MVRVANATKKPKKAYHMRKARSLPATNNLERLLCKLLERIYIYISRHIYMYRTPWMGLSWRPSSAGCLFGNVELLGYLTCQIHVHWALQVACGSRCLVYLAITGLYLKNLKNHALVPMSMRHWHSFQEIWCHEKLRKACILEKDRNFISAYFLKTGSNRPKLPGASHQRRNNI